MNRRKRGQSILEYVIILTVIVVAIITIGKPQIDTNAKKVMDNAGTVIENADNLFEKNTIGGN